MQFRHRIAGIPCRCDILFYTPTKPMQVTGSGMGDCTPPEEEEFEFRLLNLRGYPIPWLEKKMTDQDILDIRKKFFDQLHLNQLEDAEC